MSALWEGQAHLPFPGSPSRHTYGAQHTHWILTNAFAMSAITIQDLFLGGVKLSLLSLIPTPGSSVLTLSTSSICLADYWV